MKYHIITPVWGELYVRPFLEITLPNLLTPGNLGAFAPGEAVFRIFTSARDARNIAASPVYRKLAGVAGADLVEVDNLVESSERQDLNDHGSAIPAMNRCHRMAMEDASREGAALVFIPPDSVYSEGAFKRMREYVAGGKRVIAVAGARLAKETFAPAFAARFGGQDGAMPAPPRELVALAMKHLHPIAESLFVDSERFGRAFPTHLYWKIGDSGILARAMHLHPMLVWPRDRRALSSVSFDGDYILKACPSIRDYQVVTDSDDITVFEYSASTKLAEVMRPARFGLVHFAGAVKGMAHGIHRKFLQRKIRIHAGDIGSEWAEAERMSDSIVRRALFMSAMYNRMPNTIMEPMDHVRRAVIFGGGSGGAYAERLAAKLGWDVAYYVDNNSAKWGGMAGAIEVKSPDALEARDFDIVIVASIPGKREIFKQLGAMGLSYRKDFIYFQDSVSIGGFQVGLSPTIFNQV